jgi:hypothetical protein
VEEAALDAVRVALHVERPLAEVRKRAASKVEVVSGEVALRQPGLREEQLVRVADGNVVPADSHFPFIRRSPPGFETGDAQCRGYEGEPAL